MVIAGRRLWVLRRVLRVFDMPHVGAAHQLVRAFHVAHFFPLEDGDPALSLETVNRDLRWLADRGLLERPGRAAEYRPTDAGRDAAATGRLP